MGIFSFLQGMDINQGVSAFRKDPRAVLLDVRTEQEYWSGHIPGSQNIPLQVIDNAEELIENKDTPLFVYCHSGARSRQAVGILKHMGYSDVRNIGGIAAYSGKVEC